MTAILVFLLPPFLASILLTGIHAYLGIHVIRRNIIFVDLAIAQISALGAIVAFMMGHAQHTPAAYTYSFGFTAAGAVLLAFSRGWTGKLSQEVLIGIIYVMAAAAAFLLIDQAPQGAELVKQILVGSILTVTPAQIQGLVLLYGAVALFHWRFRKQFILLSFEPDRAARQGMNLRLWDFLFYLSFGLVVTSSVSIGGVLLVFSFLIIPAAIGTLFHARILPRLLIGWLAGTLASAVGLGASFAWDLPTGAAMVMAFGLALVVAGLARFLTGNAFASALGVVRNTARWGICLASLASGAWLLAMPQADQPLFKIVDRVAPEFSMAFLTADEKHILADSVQEMRRLQVQFRRMDAEEQDTRWQGKPLSDAQVGNLAAFEQVYQEMTKGESFVQQQMEEKARARQRWVFGPPLVLLPLAWLLASGWRPRRRPAAAAP